MVWLVLRRLESILANSNVDAKTLCRLSNQVSSRVVVRRTANLNRKSAGPLTRAASPTCLRVPANQFKRRSSPCRPSDKSVHFHFGFKWISFYVVTGPFALSRWIQAVSLRNWWIARNQDMLARLLFTALHICLTWRVVTGWNFHSLKRSRPLISVKDLSRLLQSNLTLV